MVAVLVEVVVVVAVSEEVVAVQVAAMIVT